MGGWPGGWPGGWVAGSIETKAISASNLKLKLKLTEAELGNRPKSTRSLSNISYNSLASSKVGSGMCKTHNDESKGISSNFS